MNKGAARHGQGPKSTPAYADGKLFSIGMTGVITAYDAETGKELWRKPGSDLLPMFTTHAFSPVVDRGVVIFHPGGHDKGAITAFDVNTGATKWTWEGDGPGYGSPIIADLGGVRQLIALTQGQAGWPGRQQPARCCGSGRSSARISPIRRRRSWPATVSSCRTAVRWPAVTVARRDGKWITEEAWTNADQPYRLSNPVLVGETLFGLSTRNSGQYFALDVKTGKSLWTSEPRQAGQAAVVKAGPMCSVSKTTASSSWREPARRPSSRCAGTRWPTPKHGRSPRSPATGCS